MVHAAAVWMMIRIACGLSTCIITVAGQYDTKEACLASVGLLEAGRTDFCLTGSCGCQPSLSGAAMKGMAVRF